MIDGEISGGPPVEVNVGNGKSGDGPSEAAYSRVMGTPKTDEFPVMERNI